MKTNFTHFVLIQKLKHKTIYPGSLLILIICSTYAFSQTTITTLSPTPGITSKGQASRTGYGGMPTITSFTPASGPIGTMVTISGANFDTVPNNNVVYFGDVSAPVSAASRTSLAVRVPAGATFKTLSVTNSHFTAYSSKPYLVTFAGGGRIFPSSFIQALRSTAVGGNSTVTTGDLDGDGKPDLVIENNDSLSISVFRNTSSGGNYSFATKKDCAMDYTTRDVSLVDLDGDGKLDMVATDVISGLVICRNTSTIGNISFATKFSVPAGVHPTRMSQGDFDGDGRPDVAVVNILENKIIIFRNTGSLGAISFGPAIMLPAGLAPATLSVADIDGDGKSDIVATVTGENTVSIFINTSTTANISFGPKVDLAGGLAPYGLAVGDMDGDGKPDIVVSNVKEATYAVYKNASTSGVVSFAPRITLPGNGADFTVCLSDLDGDGKLDIVTLKTITNSVAVFKNNSTAGTLSFVEKVSFTTGTTPLSVTVADINGDGKYDIISSNFTQSFTVLKNNILEAIALYPHRLM